MQTRMRGVRRLAAALVLLAAPAAAHDPVPWQDWLQTVGPIDEAAIDRLMTDPPPEMAKLHRGGGPCARYAPGWTPTPAQLDEGALALLDAGIAEVQPEAVLGALMRHEAESERSHHEHSRMWELTVHMVGKEPPPEASRSLDELVPEPVMSASFARAAAKLDDAQRRRIEQVWDAHPLLLRSPVVGDVLEHLYKERSRLAAARATRALGEAVKARGRLPSDGAELRAWGLEPSLRIFGGGAFAYRPGAKGADLVDFAEDRVSGGAGDAADVVFTVAGTVPPASALRPAAAPMKRVAGGTVVLGCPDGRCCDVPIPPAPRTVAAFEVDEHETTLGEYQRCVDAGACGIPTCGWPPGDPQLPVQCVEWFQADAYCRWRGARLPTRDEWMRAAAGPQGWPFPWGPALEPKHKPDAGHPVSSDARDVSPEGVRGLGSGVDEWVADVVTTSLTGPVHQGPAGESRLAMAGSSHHACAFAVNPYAPMSLTGFRCARDVAP
jgi:formylglycine-generating enzyme required for sulfatase activity